MSVGLNQDELHELLRDIRNEALEEAAGVCDSFQRWADDMAAPGNLWAEPEELAEAIRKLKSV